MMYIQNLISTICKLVFVTVLLCGLCCFNTNSSVFSVPLTDEDESLSVDYSKFNIDEIKTAANGYFNNALKETDEAKKTLLLKNAMARYYILSNVEKENPDNFVALARIYDMQKNDRYAKAYFFNALGINSKNPNANYYFAEYYYDRDKYRQALQYYKKALSYGYKGESSGMLKKMGYIYEQYGDLERANMYYKNSVSLKADPELSKKIQDIDGANYSSTGYDKKKLRK